MLNVFVNLTLPRLEQSRTITLSVFIHSLCRQNTIYEYTYVQINNIPLAIYNKRSLQILLAPARRNRKHI